MRYSIGLPILCTLARLGKGSVCKTDKSWLVRSQQGTPFRSYDVREHVLLIRVISQFESGYDHQIGTISLIVELDPSKVKASVRFRHGAPILFLILNTTNETWTIP